VLDPIETLSYVAAITKKVKLGLSVLVAAYQGPLLAARRLATLDVLSGGRVLCGVGGGWSRDEYEACSVPFKNRDARMAELLRAMIAVWTQDTVEFKGKFYAIAPSKIGPKPVQKPHPPIYQAAYTPRALKRTAELADGWNPGGPPSWDWLVDQTKQLRDMTKQAGRKPEAQEIVLRAFVGLSDQPRPANGWLFNGTLEQIKADTKRAAELGVAHILFEVQFNPGMNLQTMLKQAEQLRGIV
jgi:probable F420-dependent oxidoreductase